MKKMLLVLVALLSFGLSGFVLAEVNINSATQAELETLKGIGPAKAKAIIDYRKKNGAFKSTNDLSNVDGIGEKTVSALGKEITISGKSASKPTAKPVKEMK